MAGVALGHIRLRFAWQAWHLWHWVAPLGSVLVAGDAAALCVARVALGDIHVRFAWQAWHLVTSAFVLRGRRGTRSHPLSFHVAGVALMALGGALGSVLVAGEARHFVWQTSRLATSTFVSRGRRGTWSHPPSFCVAGVALMALGGALGSVLVASDAAALCVAGVALGHIHFRFTWQAWHLVTSAFVLRGRRGTYGTGWRRLGRFWSPVTPRHFAWHAWHLATSTFVLRGRRGTWSHPPSFCVAGVALGHIHFRFTWQEWHLWHWVARLGRFWSPVKRGTLCGRRRAWRHPLSFHVAGVALGHIRLRFAWQAWHLWHWVARLGRFWSPVTPRHFAWQTSRLATSTFVSRDRCGTWSHPPSFCVAGVALVALGGALGSVLVAGDAAALCVAGVALGHIHFRFTWQAWHLVT